jgi:hypothetical protein
VHGAPVENGEKQSNTKAKKKQILFFRLMFALNTHLYCVQLQEE